VDEWANTYLLNNPIRLLLKNTLKLKLFGVLLSINIIVSVRRLFTEPTMSIDNETPNGLSLGLEGKYIATGRNVVHKVISYIEKYFLNTI